MCARILRRSTSKYPVNESEYIGIAGYTNQLFRHAVKNGFQFTLMVVGQSGLGKSTFINTLLQTNLSEYEGRPLATTTKINERIYYVVENKVKLKLTLIDTPDFVDSRFSEYMDEEIKIERKTKIEDKRVHLCLYFISPSGHSLSEIDIKFMKKLHDKVNIIPVIAKSDTLTTSELSLFKSTILDDIQKNEIKIYEFPVEEEVRQDISKPYKRVPFGIVCSNSVIKDQNGHLTRIRKYPWGIVEVENLEHNDFVFLRDIIFKKHFIDFVEETHCVHYENYRYNRLVNKFKDSTGSFNPVLEAGKKITELENEFNKQKLNMDKIFTECVLNGEIQLKEKEFKLKESETKLKEELFKKKEKLKNLRGNIQNLVE
ncbi:Septin-2 [Strongyloides ratti]|uniref:Septin n=1 Tax=Strongyloides ratti TaxID=34506 RepID=A0A090L7C9_STRRB|nr:Septin-2 [Strongyloides ratti]CEF65632.1 Septin-2 [Strongyloides ratti]